MNQTRFAIMQALMMGAAFGDVMGGYNSNTIHNRVSRKSNPWDTINLSKSERRGKSYEELQEMRKARYAVTHAS